MSEPTSRSRILDDMVSHVDYAAAVNRRAHGLPPARALPTPDRSVATASVVHGAGKGTVSTMTPSSPHPRQLTSWHYYMVTGAGEDRPMTIDFPVPRSVAAVRVDRLIVHRLHDVHTGANRVGFTLTFADSPDGRTTDTCWKRNSCTVHVPAGNYSLDQLCAVLEARLNDALAHTYCPTFDHRVVQAQVRTSHALTPTSAWPCPFFFRVRTVATLRRDAERGGEADTDLDTFLTPERWKPQPPTPQLNLNLNEQEERRFDPLRADVLALAHHWFAQNPWVWHDLACERDAANDLRWPYHTLLHELMATASSPETVPPLEERLTVTLEHRLFADPKATAALPNALKYWKPYVTVPTFSLDVPRSLARALGLPAGATTSEALTTGLPPLARYCDGRDHVPVPPGDQAWPCTGDLIQGVYGGTLPLAPPGALLVKVHHGETHILGRVYAAGVHGAAAGSCGDATASPSVATGLDNVCALTLRVTDENGQAVQGSFTAMVSVQ